jgi:hypothetical protein
MKFPITRESLQAFDPAKEREELKEEAIQKNFNQLLDIICNEFKRNMHTNSKEKKYVWRNLHLARNLHLSGFSQGTTDEYLPRFIEKLKETFIGCDIIIDPLKTYLIIDWS